MKNNSLIALALLAFLALAWYRVILLPTQTEASTAGLKAEARESIEKGSPEMAVKRFNELLAVKDSLEDRQEVFGYYWQCLEEGSIEFGSRDLQRFVTETLNRYPDRAESYEMAMSFWLEEGNLPRSADIMKRAVAHEAVSEQLQRDYDAIKYTYRVNTNRYLGVLDYSEGMQPVQNGDSWVYFNDNMRPVFQKEFDCQTICNDGYIAVRTGDSVKLLDPEGKVEDVFRLAEGMELAGAYGNKHVPVVKDGKYSYVDLTGESELTGYDYAGTYINKRAAVQQGERWSVINTVGEAVIGDVAEVVLDGSGRCAVGGYIFVRQGSGYSIYNIKGEKVADVDAEQVKCFDRDQIAAACKDGKWGFVDTTGKWVIAPKFDDARSFCNGFAAVCVDGAWGYIDTAGVQAVEPQFEDVTSVTSGGRSLVLVNDLWKILEFMCR